MFSKADVPGAQKHLPFEEYSQYALKKAKDAEYLNYLELASNLIDIKHPESQERAYSLVPELKSEPESYFQEQLKQQLILYHMLQVGQVTNREEMDFLYMMLAPDYKLPTNYLWDFGGAIAGEKNGNEESISRGLFNPYRFSFDNGSGYQQEMKAKILKRVLPNFRQMALANVKTFVQQFEARVIMAGQEAGTLDGVSKNRDGDSIMKKIMRGI